MNKITKIVFFTLLLCIALTRLLTGEWILALLLLILLVIAIPYFDKRENHRQFYRGLRKLYVCVDKVGFISARDSLLKNALFPKTTRVPYTLLGAIELYYMGHLVDARKELMTIQAKDDYLFWKSVYLIMIDNRLSQPSLQKSAVRECAVLLSKVPKPFKSIARSRLELMNVIVNDPTIETYEAIRATMPCNLLVAEVTDMMASIQDDERLSTYYYKAAKNIGKELILS